MTKKSVSIAILVVLLTVTGCLSSGVANASPRGAGGGGYLALGDSVPFGYSPALEDPWIPERFVGYPEVIGQQTGLTTTNLACPGQTAQAIVSLSAPDAGCFEMREFAHDAGFALLRTEYDGSQLDAALDAVRSDTPPALISIQGGGNDVAMCVFDDPDPEQCLAETIPKVAQSLLTAATQLRAAGYSNRVV